ncbi:glycoside hydrolase family 16 protein [Planosporangium mesophilum]|uniref:Endo-1,3-beta-glucanase n=1 Tax=Planosporangium mesophilum TaxID=689768 RepID=A0A8J3TBL6_9ACTN|nr:glycoside hydrolase family 16 protein [Planosporangium mesophilum]NJC85838.1 carbohydrate-binding protein [Planosporangium mesophilum]GII21899.1 endo-1,3-beta-glucanase [Planosporangium mesophilum]
MSPPTHALPRSRGRAFRLLTVAAALLVVVASWLTTRVSAAAAPPAPPGWSLAFSDDFSGAANTGVNRSNWLYDLGHGYPGGAGNWGTGEIENMTDSTANVYQDGAGHLAIKPIRDGAGNWTSGRIETQRTDFAAPAGGKLRVEASLQQPNVSGAAAAGYWPAFWMLGAAARPVGATNWPSIGEIDIMEDINGRSSEFSTLHCGTASGGPCNETTGIGSGERACGGCQTGFHTYAMEYDRSVSPEQIRWYLDGNNFFTVDSNRVDATTWNNATHHGFFIILNVAMGGGFPGAFGGGPTAATQSGVPMLVDYVAVYTSGGGGGGTTPPPPPPPSGGGSDAYSTIQAESFNAQGGTQTEACSDSGGGQDVAFIANGDWLQFNNVNFGSNAAHQFSARVASGAAGGVSGLVEVRLDSRSNAPIGSFSVANTGGWQSWRTVPANTSAVTGTHTVYLTFTSGQPADFVNVNWFTFGH